MSVTNKEAAAIISGLFCLLLYFLIPLPQLASLAVAKGMTIKIEPSNNSTNLTVKLDDGQISVFKVTINENSVIQKLESLNTKTVNIWYSNDYELAYGVQEAWQLSYYDKNNNDESDEKFIVNYDDMVYQTKLVKSVILVTAVLLFMRFIVLSISRILRQKLK